MKTRILAGLTFVVALGSLGAFQDEPARPKFGVTISDDKAVIVAVEGGGLVDPTQRIRFQNQGQGNFYVNLMTQQNQQLHLSHFPMFWIGNTVTQANVALRSTPLPKTPSGKARVGYTMTWVAPSGLHITQMVEVIPSKAKKTGDKRLMDTVLIAYGVENKSTQPVRFGLRVCMDTYVIDNDGCLFAAPTMPDKVLDGVVLKDKAFPPYVRMLQHPNLNNPGYAAHLTFNMGSRYEKADKVVLSSLQAGFGNWEMNAQPAMGDSAISFYWPIKELKPGGKRDCAYGFGGQSPAVPPESEGRFQLALGGSFEPGKIFTVSAAVADPTVGQSLALELPPGMQRLEGTEIQPVAPLAEGQEFSTVLWKARVLQPGEHTLRIRSSTGVTQSKIIAVTQATP